MYQEGLYHVSCKGAKKLVGRCTTQAREPYTKLAYSPKTKTRWWNALDSHPVKNCNRKKFQNISQRLSEVLTRLGLGRSVFLPSTQQFSPVRCFIIPPCQFNPLSRSSSLRTKLISCMWMRGRLVLSSPVSSLVIRWRCLNGKWLLITMLRSLISKTLEC